jgi:hypothetical protein
VPAGTGGYPSAGFQGGLVRAHSIHRLEVGQANVFTQTSQNPNYVQNQRTGYARYYTNPGYALTNATIVTTDSIDSVQVDGNSLNSNIKTGFDYTSYAAGLEGTRAASRIRRLHQFGSLVSSVTSASFRPSPETGVYSFATGQAGNGDIRGRTTGGAYNTGSTTPLGTTGAGYFAKRRSRGLPPTTQSS